VYSEELVAQRVVSATRYVNDRLGTVDFLDKGELPGSDKVGGWRVKG
jgi:hypothetical protein